MLFVAVSAIEKIRQVPVNVWVNVLIGLVGFIVLVILIKRIATMNKFILSMAVFVIGGLVFFSWIYNRNEPAFLTPFIDEIAQFFPSKGAYKAKQQSEPAEKRPKNAH